MGADCKIYLSGDTRVGDAAKVLGKLAGLESHWGEDREHGARWVTVPGADVVCTVVPEMVQIIVGEYKVYWHFEEHPYRLMAPRSTAFWIAAGRRLVEFFGGYIDYDDSDRSEKDYALSSPRTTNSPDDGAEWDVFQQAISDLRPLTLAEIKNAQQYAAYK